MRVLDFRLTFVLTLEISPLDNLKRLQKNKNLHIHEFPRLSKFPIVKYTTEWAKDVNYNNITTCLTRFQERTPGRWFSYKLRKNEFTG